MQTRITISLRDEQINYFKGHPELNRSEFIRRAVDEHINNTIRDRLSYEI